MVSRKANSACALFLFSFISISAPPHANAACGKPDSIITGSKAFNARPFGTLAIKQDETFLGLKPGNCTVFNHSNGQIKMVMNHFGRSSEEAAYLAAQVTFVRFSDAQSKTYLFRNHTDDNRWLNDKDKSTYYSLHPAGPEEFKKALDGEKSEFDKKFRNESDRIWNDEITTRSASGRYSTWNSRQTFVAHPNVLDGASRGDFGARSQNYLIAFTTRTTVQGRSDKPVDLNLDIAGAHCVFIRTSGSTNVASSLEGEYLLQINGDTRCESLVPALSATGFFEGISNFFFHSSSSPTPPSP